MIPGSYHMPLSYVVREREDLDHDHDFGDDFISEMIACPPLHGTHFRADSRCVHQLLKTYVVAETAEQWIMKLEPHVNSRRDMLALREHYSGEGNASRCIATAERMREGQHYKNERSVAFSIFLDRMQKMFNIYEEEGEELIENAKLRELFKRVQHPQLQDTVKAFKVRFDMEGITYTQAANDLTAAVLELPEYHLTCNVSASSSGVPWIRGGGGSGHNSSVKKKWGIQAPNKASSCQTDRVLLGITRSVQNCQKRTNSGCWIREIRRRTDVLAASDKFQALHPSQSSYNS